MRFAREDCDARYSKTRKRSSEVLREPSVTNSRVSDTAGKVATCTPAGPRSSVHENGIRSATKGFHSVNRHVKVVQMRDKLWSVYPQTSDPRATISKHTGFKRPKSVQTRGTQLHSTPIQCDSRPDEMRTKQNLQTTEPQATTSKQTSFKHPPDKLFQTRGTQLHSTPIPCDARPVRMKPKLNLLTTMPQATTSKHTGSKRLSMKSVQTRGTQLDSTPNASDARLIQMGTELNPQTTEPQATTSKHTGSKRLSMKSVQTRGTQLDSTPNAPGGRIRSPSLLQTPSIVRQLEEMPLESASIAWSHFRSPSIVGQTPCHQQPETQLNESPGNNTYIHTYIIVV